ncbi:hypothetical protein JHK87_055481 [Glycine soja]|nr:hypothetical protein JHK87_055481 [Glycine soja]
MGATSEAIAKIFQVPLEKPLRKNRRRHLRPHLAHLNQIPAGTPSKSIAIKKFKQSKDDDDVSPTTICKIMLLREITHENVVKLVNVHINHVDMSLYLAFDYAKHDLYFVAQWTKLSAQVMSEGEEHGVVKMADFGLARIYQAPLKPLCDNGLDQLDKIFKVLVISQDIVTMQGHPTLEKWPSLVSLPHWQQDVQHIQGHKYDNAGLYNVVLLSPKNLAYDLLSKMLNFNLKLSLPALYVHVQMLVDKHPYALFARYFKIEPLPGRKLHGLQLFHRALIAVKANAKSQGQSLL